MIFTLLDPIGPYWTLESYNGSFSLGMMGKAAAIFSAPASPILLLRMLSHSRHSNRVQQAEPGNHNGKICLLILHVVVIFNGLGRFGICQKALTHLFVFFEIVDLKQT